MANNLKNNPWVIDTASASALASTPVCVQAALFNGYTTATDTVTLKDNRGIIIAVISGNADLEPVEVCLWGVSIDGLAVTQISSGRLTIFLSE